MPASVLDASVLDRLDRLAAAGSITGYTVEPAPEYLSQGIPSCTYSVYRDDHLGRRNLARLVSDLIRLGAEIQSHHRTGTVASAGRLRRTREVSVVARLPGGRRLGVALDLICERHSAAGARPRAGSWQIPDVRVCGARADEPGTVAAFAHTRPVAGGCAVVLTLGPQPPLQGMASHPVRLLACWASYLAVIPA